MQERDKIVHQIEEKLNMEAKQQKKEEERNLKIENEFKAKNAKYVGIRSRNNATCSRLVTNGFSQRIKNSC